MLKHVVARCMQGMQSACSLPHVSVRCVSSSPALRDLRDFLDKEAPESPAYGRAWLAAELRHKSWGDLHRLWYVCVKERNMVQTQMLWNKDKTSYGERYVKVKLTMNRIKQVMSERATQEPNAVSRLEMKKIIHLM